MMENLGQMVGGKVLCFGMGASLAISILSLWERVPGDHPSNRKLYGHCNRRLYGRRQPEVIIDPNLRSVKMETVFFLRMLREGLALFS
jgi:hypothetical protein